MKKTKLGEFEELVLLTVAALQQDAYGVEIKRELEERLKETLSVGSIQSALKRMEEKGFLNSAFGEATLKRGGKRKRIYYTTSLAHKVLCEMKDIRAGLWNDMPKLSHQLKVIITSVVFAFVTINSLSQSKDWKNEKTKDGKVSVKSIIAERTDENNKVVQLIEFVATTVDSVNLRDCVAVMKDIGKHKNFWGAQKSDKLKSISENEWIIYYYFDSPWPAPNYDYVARMNFAIDPTNKMATFTLTATPKEFEKTDVKRMTHYNVTYTFKDVGNGKTEMTTTSSASPVFKAPAWLVSSYFPNGPAGILKRIAKLAKVN
jgi:PadR family transcriptional regulator, regulatory protein PadR